MSDILSTQQYIDNVTKIHGDEYDYSELEYTGWECRVKILCKRHGPFVQLATSHLQGAGCRRCYHERLRLDKSDLINRFVNKHGDGYDYSNFEHTQLQTKCEFVCKLHGKFMQTPAGHLKSNTPCKQCRKINRLNELRTDFTNAVKEKHGDLFELDLSFFGKVNDKINVKCKVCGHNRTCIAKTVIRYMDEGCYNCIKVEFAKSLADKFTELHGYKYQYELPYSAVKNDVISIRCPEHGLFRQRIKHHLEGKGCSTCRESQGELEIAKYLTNMGIAFEREKQFDTCKHQRHLRFDFYVESLNTLIEYQGNQHFQLCSNEFFGDQENLNLVQYRDLVKRIWCFQNQVNLIWITKGEDVTSKLDKHLVAGRLSTAIIL